DEQRIIEQVADRANLAVINVHDVRDRFKRVKRNPQRQGDLEDGLLEIDAEPVARRVDVGHEKVEVLEEREQAQVRADAQGQDDLAPRGRFRFLEQQRGDVIDGSRKEHKQDQE